MPVSTPPPTCPPARLNRTALRRSVHRDDTHPHRWNLSDDLELRSRRFSAQTGFPSGMGDSLSPVSLHGPFHWLIIGIFPIYASHQHSAFPLSPTGEEGPRDDVENARVQCCISQCCISEPQQAPLIAGGKGIRDEGLLHEFCAYPTVLCFRQ